jgi:uncharacterized damage-inducible protein DinB
MNLKEILMSEFAQETALTRKMLEKVPFDNPQWKPHEKSMTMQRLSSHIAEIPLWANRTLDSDEFDFATAKFERFFAVSNAELLKKFQETSASATSLLKEVTDETLQANWSLKRGGHLIYSIPRIAVLRNYVFSHTAHHRGQLSVYLRLHNISVPGMYGPSADEK